MKRWLGACCSSMGVLAGPSVGVGAVGAAALMAGLAMAGVAQEEVEEAKVTARLVSPVTAVAPGETVELGLEFTIEPGWHIYWAGRNDTGFEPMMRWSSPEGVDVGEAFWPTPERHISPGRILDHVYEGRATLFVPVTVPADAEAGASVTLSADLEWLVCKDICIPEYGSVSIELPVASGGGDATPAASRLRAARALVPGDGPDDRLSWRVEDGAVVIEALGASRVEFYPSRGSAEIAGLLEHGRAEGSGLRLPIEPGTGSAVSGIVRYWPAGGRGSVARRLTIGLKSD